MKIIKYTHGFVEQVFDTKKKYFVSQDFVAGDDVVYEDEIGKVLDKDCEAADHYLEYEMLQPEYTQEQAVRVIRNILSTFTCEGSIKVLQYVVENKDMRP